MARSAVHTAPRRGAPGRLIGGAVAVAAAIVAAGLGGCGGKGDAGGQPHVAYVTNGVDPFWTIAEKGALDAGREFDARVEVRMPTAEGVPDQKRKVEELLVRGIDGIAISPIDAKNQSDFLREQVARRTLLITHDSDAPESGRLCYIGMDNYEAGRMCGQLVKEALPQGGQVMIFVGRLGQMNAQLRRQGVIDELLDRVPDPTRYDPPGGEIKGDKYVILDTRTDDFDYNRAKAQAQDAIAKYPQLGCMVGLFAYNPPKCLEAVRDANLVGKIQIVAFDENEATLQGILDGAVHGTVVQNPYRYGYESVRVLAALKRGDQSVLPEGGVMNIPARKITKANAEEFWTELKRLTSPAAPAAAPQPTQAP